MGTTERDARWLREWLARIGFHCLVWSLVGVVLVPLVWPLMVALNPVDIVEFVERGPLWWARGVEFGGVIYTVAFSPLLRYIGNSVVVATAAGALGAAFAASGAYGLERFDFAGSRVVSVGMLALLMVPQTLVTIPLFLQLRNLGLFDTRLGLVLAYVAFTLPFTIWLLRPLFANIPETREEAAMVDGTTQLGAFVRVFLPSAKPAVAAAFAFGWILAYNEFIFAAVLIDSPSKRTLSEGYRYGAGAPGVAAVISALPLLAIFLIVWWRFLDDQVQQFGG